MASGITPTMQLQIAELYSALFGRAASADGQSYWASELLAGTSLTKVADEMFATPPARAFYPASYTNEQIVNNFYVIALGRTPDTDGLAYWTGQLNQAGATPGSVIVAMIGTVKNYAGTDPAGLKSQDFFNSRADVSNYYALKGGDDAGAASILVGVTDVDSTVSAAKAAIDNPVVPGQTFTLTTANDLFVGVGGADTFSGTFSNGGTNTFNTGDSLTGAAGTDTLIVSPNIAATAITLSDAFWNSVSGIENIVFSTTSDGAQTFVTNNLFNTAFTAGVNLTTTSTSGAINITMGGAVNQTVAITTNSTDGIQTIDTGAGGAGTATVNATSTAGGLTISGADLASVTTHSGAGIQNINSTGAAAVIVNATSTSGAQTIATGAGNDSITVSSTAPAATINAGGGKDAITLGAGDSTIQAITVTPGHSVQTAFDTVTNFGIASGSGSDTLALGSTTLLTNAADTLLTWTVTAGIASLGGSLSAFILAATTTTAAGVVAYYDAVGGNTYVVASDGMASGALDTVVELIGITTATAVAGEAAATTIHIV